MTSDAVLLSSSECLVPVRCRGRRVWRPLPRVEAVAAYRGKKRISARGSAHLIRVRGRQGGRAFVLLAVEVKLRARQLRQRDHGWSCVKSWSHWACWPIYPCQVACALSG